ncbi:MAG: DUF4404 family protein [Burkholderiaceae bacterium]
MSDEKKQLDESIRELRSQIDSLTLEDDRAGHLRSLVDDVDRMSRTSGAAEAPANLGERITTSILQFEVSHPRIALALNEIGQKLSDIGI